MFAAEHPPASSSHRGKCRQATAFESRRRPSRVQVFHVTAFGPSARPASPKRRRHLSGCDGHEPPRPGCRWPAYPRASRDSASGSFMVMNAAVQLTRVRVEERAPVHRRSAGVAALRQFGNAWAAARRAPAQRLPVSTTKPTRHPLDGLEFTERRASTARTLSTNGNFSTLASSSCAPVQRLRRRDETPCHARSASEARYRPMFELRCFSRARWCRTACPCRDTRSRPCSPHVPPRELPQVVDVPFSRSRPVSLKPARPIAFSISGLCMKPLPVRCGSVVLGHEQRRADIDGDVPVGHPARVRVERVDEAVAAPRLLAILVVAFRVGPAGSARYGTAPNRRRRMGPPCRRSDIPWSGRTGPTPCSPSGPSKPSGPRASRCSPEGSLSLRAELAVRLRRQRAVS